MASSDSSDGDQAPWSSLGRSDGAQPNSWPPTGAPPPSSSLLWEAAKNGDVDGVMRLARVGGWAAVTEPNAAAAGATAFWIAAKKGNLILMQKLVALGIRDNNDLGMLTQPNTSGQTPLFIAAKYGKVAVIKWLVEQSALFHGVLREDLEMIAEPNTAGETPLWIAAKRGHLSAVHWLYAAELLGNDGSTVLVMGNQPRNDGITPLLAAAGKGHLEVAQWLGAFEKEQQGHVVLGDEQVE